MGRHTYFGQLVAHDVMNGIDHANIDPELTVENWESKAIVRDGNYVWVRKGTYKDEQGDEITGYYESFNARLRDELLNGEVFYTSKEAQIIIEQWRRNYNTTRPHSALGYHPAAPETIIPMVPRPIMH